jgi:hypothetical protein
MLGSGASVNELEEEDVVQEDRVLQEHLIVERTPISISASASSLDFFPTTC